MHVKFILKDGCMSCLDPKAVKPHGEIGMEEQLGIMDIGTMPKPIYILTLHL